MQNTENKETRIAVYKWIKIIQSILLIVLGLALVLISLIRINKELSTSIESISYCIGVAFSAYGIINMVSGYLLERSPIAREVIMGICFSALGIAFIVKPQIITEIFPIIIISCAYLFAVMLVLFGVEKIIGKQVKKNIPTAVLLFICAGALIALATLYIFYYKDTSVLNYALAGLGLVLAILGIASIAILLIKIRNTKEIEKEEEIRRFQEAEAAKQNEKIETKIIDISELRKRNGKKVYNKETNEMSVTESEVAIVEAPAQNNPTPTTETPKLESSDTKANGRRKKKNG